MKKGNRKKGLLVFFTADEYEYLKLKAKATGYSMATLVRLGTFRAAWQSELKCFRQMAAGTWDKPNGTGKR